MKRKISLMALGLVFLGLIAGALYLQKTQTQFRDKDSDLKSQINQLVDETTMSKTKQAVAFKKIEDLGDKAVPYIISHLGDMRKLAYPEIILENKFSNAHEKYRTYQPEFVHDGLAAILNQVTGKFFGQGFEDISKEQRISDKREWTDWCMKIYVANSNACTGR